MSNHLQVPWPELPTAAWRDTYATLHLWTQVVGKIRLTKSPWLNHSWHVALYVTPRGLTTSPIPDGARTFQIDFDFIDHVLRIATSDGAQRQFALAGQSVASFYAATLAALAELGIAVAIDERPNELPEPITFSQDSTHASYDPDAARVRRYNERLRRDAWTRTVAHLSARFPLRPGLELQYATDILLVLLGPSTYQTLVGEYGWSSERWRIWCASSIAQELFAEPLCGVHASRE